MCKYAMVAGDLRLPVEDALGEEQVIKRAINLLSSYPDLELLKDCGGRGRPVERFIILKEDRLRKQQEEKVKKRQIHYVERNQVSAHN